MAFGEPVNFPTRTVKNAVQRPMTAAAARIFTGLTLPEAQPIVNSRHLYRFPDQSIR
jgi:hypothetical protein